MANSRIKGITIEIGGNTTKLQAALKDVDKQISGLNTDLKGLDKALKLDPKNPELLAQKYDVLSRNIAATKQKIDTLKEAQRQMGDYNSLTEEQKSNYSALTTEIAKAETELSKMNSQLKNSNKIDFSKLTNALKKVGEVAVQVAKKIGQITLAIGGALAGIVSLGVKSYAELEQNLGGVQTMFEDAGESVEDLQKRFGWTREEAQKYYDTMDKEGANVIENAKRAYKTAGISANEYMRTVTSFSAALIKSLDGDTAESARVADMALKDMADNANKFGTDMQSIQNAYQGFAKQNYTMLDNLKLGYGGTKTEMQRLLKDAQKISGVKYDINNLSDVYNAIHVIQEEMGVTGTTAAEAERTISGSVNSMKAAFDNFLNGSGSPEDLAKTITNVFTNISDAIVKLAPSILSGVVTLIQTVLPQIVTTIAGMLPQLLQAITNLINSLFDMVTQNTEKIRETTTLLINKFVEFVTTNLPKIIELALTLIITLAQGIADALKDPKFVQSIVNCVLEIVNIITDNLQLIIDVALQLIIALTDGIVAALPQLAEKLPLVTQKICDVLLDNLEPILKAALYIVVELAKAIIQNLPQLAKNIFVIPRKIFEWIKEKKADIINAGWEILKNLLKGFTDKIGDFATGTNDLIGKVVGWIKNGVSKIKDAGKDLINGMWSGIQERWNGLKNKVEDLGSGIVGKFKKVFGIASPSKIFKNEIGKYLAQGIELGFTEEMEYATQGMVNAIPVNQLASNVSTALRSLNSGIESSLNPTINPTIAYENNYKMMAEVFKEALGEMKVELDDREMGKFIDQTVVNEVFS